MGGTIPRPFWKRGKDIGPWCLACGELRDASCRGRVFGFHRAIDTMGALAGPSCSPCSSSNVPMINIRLIFFSRLSPAVVGVILLIAFVKDIRKEQNTVDAVPPSLRGVKLSRDFKIFLLVSAVFAVGNSSDAFLILRAQETLGFLWVWRLSSTRFFNAAYALTSFPAGSGYFLFFFFF